MNDTKTKKSLLIENALIFLFFAVFVFLFNMQNQRLPNDLMWCFHMSQKVANGYLVYSEISTVVTPIYFWIGGLFINIFGNTLVSMHIYARNSIWSNCYCDL